MAEYDSARGDGGKAGTRAVRYARVLREKTHAGRRLQTAARDRQHRYRVLADAIPQLVGIVDSSLQLVYVNASCRTYTGQTAAVINDTSGAWIVHREDQFAVADARLALAANLPFECDLRLRRADGRYRWHAMRIVPLENVAGETPHWLLIATDVDDSKSVAAIIRAAGDPDARSGRTDGAETTGLREANRLLVMAEEMAHVGHYRLDLVSNEVYWSSEVYNTYGLAPSFTPNLGWVFSAYHPDDRERVIEIVRQTLADGSPFNYSARIVRPDGTTRTVAAGGHVERTADGKIIALFGVLQDVTSFQNAERERGKLSERVMLATKAGNIGIWEWNVAENRMEWDGAMYALYGIEDTSIAPAYDTWIRSIHPADREHVETQIQPALDGAFVDVEFRVLWPGGGVRYLRTTGALIHDPAGAGSRIVGATWDVTEVRVLAEDLRDQKERAEEATRAKSEFLARMSHEIRTPMNGIIGFTTLVLDGDLSAEQRRHVLLLRDAGRSLLAIINDILDFSKLEAGKIDLERVPINLNALVDGALSIVRGDVAPKGIVLDTRLAPDVPDWVCGDPTRLRQTLLNLLTNALKFTEHGSIRLSVERDPEAPHERIRFEIADTGIGIAADKRHLLFRDFSQVEKSTTRRYGGTGLGLAICKHLVEAMGGSIGMESEPGAGSVFWFTAQLPKVAAPAIAESDPPDPISARRILVADDNRVNQIVVEALLTRDGHAVVLAENGADAVELIAHGQFDLVLMDMQMPVMDGLEATRAIRRLPKPACGIPIVALTANAMDEEVELCYAAGMNGHLAKPIDRQLLRGAVARWASETCEAPKAAEAARSGETANPSPIDTPILEFASLLELFDGDLGRVGEIFDAALVSLQTDCTRIEAAAAEAEPTALVEAAHRMKGTSGSIGAQRVRELGARVEQTAKQGKTVDPLLLGELFAAVAQVRARLTEFHAESARIAC